VIQNMPDKELVHLLSALKKRRSHVQIHEMEVFPAVDRYLGPQAAARLVASHGDVVILCLADVQPAQDRVSVFAALDPPVVTEPKIHPELLCDELRLMVALVRMGMTQHFLQGDHVGVDLAQHIRDALG
jgi:hypothetical protein